MEELEIIRGDDVSIDFTYKDAAGAAIDITGYTLYLTAKPAADDDATDAAAVIEKDVTSHSDPTNGVSVITLTDSDTNITPTSYLADIQLKNAGGTIVSSGQFAIAILADITRRIS